jgi:hypothetical protein
MAIIGPIPYGKTETIISRAASSAGTITEYFHIESDSVLVSLFADVVSGTLDVAVFTLTEEGKEIGIINFPSLSAPTSELLLKKAAAAMSRIKVVATYSGATTFEVRARSIGAGESSVKILGASQAKASQLTVGTTPTLLFPVSLTDRAGMIVKNNGTSAILYIGYTVAEATTGNGYPVGPGESIGIDVGSGATIYGRSSTGTIDVRLMESAL